MTQETKAVASEPIFTEQEKYKILLQEFQRRLNADPNPEEFQPTPDGKARTLPISFVEMTLDELFLGLWETSEMSYQQVFNEVVGSIVLTVWHPVTGKPIRRVGAASVVITQDKDAQIAEFNMTKKKNALDLAFPKLKAECVKNAAQSLGRLLGRDINRKFTDTFKSPVRPLGDAGFADLLKRVDGGELDLIVLAEDKFLLTPDQKTVLQSKMNDQKLLS